MKKVTIAEAKLWAKSHEFDMHRRVGGLWFDWWSAGAKTTVRPEESVLPACVYEFLPRAKTVGSWCASYPSEREAWLALAQALTAVRKIVL